MRFSAVGVIYVLPCRWAMNLRYKHDGSGKKIAFGSVSTLVTDIEKDKARGRAAKRRMERLMDEYAEVGWCACLRVGGWVCACACAP